MSLFDLATRLDATGNDLSGMGAELAGGAQFEAEGRGPAATLAATLNGAWLSRQERLGRLSTEVTDLGAGVRLAAQRYAATDGGQ